MANFVFSYWNWVDQPGVSPLASHEAVRLPVANLQDPDVLKIWRSEGSTAPWVQVDLGQARAVRVLGLFGLARLAADDTVRWRLGSSAGAGDVYDSGAIACGRFEGYAQTVHVLDAALSARHLRVDIDAPSQAALGYVDVGRLWAGDAWQGQRNFSYGTYDDIDDGASKQVASDGAPATSVFVDPRTSGRVKNFALEGLSQAEKWTALEVKRKAGRKRQVVFVPDPASADLQREAILARIDASDPVRHMNFPFRATAFTLRGPMLEE